MHTHHRRSRLWAATATAALVALTGTLVPAAATGGATPTAASQQGRSDALTDLAHLDWLSVPVTPPAQAGHTTYRLAEEPEVGTLWTYAEPNPDGSYRHVGGGSYDAATDTWSQGAFNADDMTRAAVVYLRHWQQTGDEASRKSAYQMLRGVTYHQTTTGANAGNVVLWMQPDGTLNPSAEPVELPDPSDSDASYWLARTIWALGEGYAAFRDADPAFASFLRERLELALDAVDRQVLDRYGEHLDIDGEPAPAWLIADGADASAEAVLGLAAYTEAGGSDRARDIMRKLAEGIAELSGGDARSWPFGAIRPWALSRSLWHGWGAQMPAALARAGMAGPAVRDSFTFDPWLLTSGGADNGRLPTRIDRSQIAYGADARLQSLLATADARPGTRAATTDLAGIVAAWYFGANPAGVAMYDLATGRTFDGINNDGTVNRNSGAESTIHGLLSMLALDRHPDVARLALGSDRIAERVGTTTVEAETGRLAGGAVSRTPASLWTGESQYGGTGYVDVPAGGSVRLEVARHDRALLLPVVDQRPGSGRLVVTSGRERLGSVDAGDVGQQGDSPAPGLLVPLTVDRRLPGNTTTVTLTARGGPVALDGLMVEPALSRLVLDGGDATALLRSSADRTARTTVRLPGDGRAAVATYDGSGRRLSAHTTPARTVAVSVPAGGFAIVRR